MHKNVKEQGFSSSKIKIINNNKRMNRPQTDHYLTKARFSSGM